VISRRVAKNCVLAILIMGWSFGAVAAAAQPRVSVTVFERVEIRVSPENTIPQMRATRSEDRYELRNATFVDLISTAWDVSADNVLGGPEWLDTDRFDVLAQAPTGTTPERLKAMLQGLLRDRFGLVTHGRTEAVPAYTITVGSRNQLQAGNASALSGCDLKQNISTAPGVPRPPVTLVCENVSMGAFAKVLSDLREASGYLLGYPILDRTGLRGARSFHLKWTPRNAWHADPVAPDGTTLFDAIDNQLGLSLNLTTVPMPVVVIDHVRRPVAVKSPDAKMRFVTADISSDDRNDLTVPCGHIDLQQGGHVHIHMTLRSLILESQGDFKPHRIIDRSNRLDTTCWEVLAKAPVRPHAPIGLNGSEWNGVDINSVRMMLRTLLQERFRLVSHVERRPVSGFALIAADARLRKAEPANRPGCTDGLPAHASRSNWRDPRLTNPLASRLITCRNVTLARFAAELNRLNTGADGPIVNATAISGRYDVAVNFSPGAWFHAAQAPQPSNQLIPFAQALRTQLGLGLQTRELSEDVLIIDHVEDQPIG
jgi:uncharacterized protein (TIGR03435 family)